MSQQIDPCAFNNKIEVKQLIEFMNGINVAGVTTSRISFYKAKHLCCMI